MQKRKVQEGDAKPEQGEQSAQLEQNMRKKAAKALEYMNDLYMRYIEVRNKFAATATQVEEYAKKKKDEMTADEKTMFAEHFEKSGVLLGSTLDSGFTTAIANLKDILEPSHSQEPSSPLLGTAEGYGGAAGREPSPDLPAQPYIPPSFHG